MRGLRPAFLCVFFFLPDLVFSINIPATYHINKTKEQLLVTAHQTRDPLIIRNFLFNVLANEATLLPLVYHREPVSFSCQILNNA